MGLLGKEMVEAYHLVKLPEEDAIRNLKIPVIFDIYKEELLPAKIVVDMSDVMGDLYKSYGETTKVNRSCFSLRTITRWMKSMFRMK